MKLNIAHWIISMLELALVDDQWTGMREAYGIEELNDACRELLSF